MLGLTVDQAANALVVAAAEASGVGRDNGSMTKPLAEAFPIMRENAAVLQNQLVREVYLGVR